MNEMRIGLDLGNVIIDHNTFGTTREYVQTGNYLEIPPVGGVIDGIKELVRDEAIELVVIIYNASTVADQKINDWLHHWLPESVTKHEGFICVRSFGGRNKKFDCARFSLTHFIDDRVEVLNQLRDTVPNLILFNANFDEKLKYCNDISSFDEVACWRDLKDLIYSKESWRL